MSKQLDVTWMLLHKYKISDVPIWVGFHSKILIDDFFLILFFYYIFIFEFNFTKNDGLVRSKSLVLEDLQMDASSLDQIFN